MFYYAGHFFNLFLFWLNSDIQNSGKTPFDQYPSRLKVVNCDKKGRGNHTHFMLCARYLAFYNLFLTLTIQNVEHR